jgi:hypothetical protein
MSEMLKKSWSKARRKWSVFKIEAEYGFFFGLNRIFYFIAICFKSQLLLFVSEMIGVQNRKHRELSYRIMDLKEQIESMDKFDYSIYDDFKAKKL